MTVSFLSVFRCTRRRKRPDSSQSSSSSTSKQPSSKTPAMDLSSLEGPPMLDPRYIVPPAEETSRVPYHPPSPSPSPSSSSFAQANQNLRPYPKPLPPQPARTRSISQRHPAHRHASRPSNGSSDLSRRGGALQRTPAQRGRRSLSEELQFGELPAAQEQGQHQQREHAPLETPISPCSTLPFSPCTTLPFSPCSPQNTAARRVSTASSLVWLDNEERWMVAADSAPLSRRQTRDSHQLPLCLPTLSDHRLLERSDDDLEREEHPPTYESHEFSPTHVFRLNNDVWGWSAMARRVRQLSTGG
ncbi:hypothetical protein NUU61_009104 [Penicillium alfredii]|uniref:Uncharacterized protein n=1 Tax=Penicillium alfredii TaxID=1506179 RepID=A0A9W9JWY7_9EURO|nr:uncharacterized protein NUU61_009104 [Penicillium alfredii]KAJ5084525.1 hypothetical protein NUU61_009104 [Penicillium alfredii]